MNQRDWNQSCRTRSVDWAWYNKATSIQKSLQFNPNPKATVKHHLRNTEEQRKYNDEHYEMWGFNLDGTFEYGKYIIFITPEEHNAIHKDSEETKLLKKQSSILRWQDDDYRESQSIAIKLAWNELRRQERSKAYTGEGNPFYGRKGVRLLGDKNGMYGKHHTDVTKEKISEALRGRSVSDETREKISKSNIGHTVSSETREKISKSNTGHTMTDEQRSNLSKRYSGKNNPFYGKHHTEETKQKIRESNLGRHHTDDTKEKISLANKNKVVSDETRYKLSQTSKGENNGMYGKHHTDETLERLRNSRCVAIQRQASLAYKEYKANNGDMKWQEFRSAYIKLHRNDENIET